MASNKKRYIFPFVILIIAILIMMQLSALKQPPEKKEQEQKSLLVEVTSAVKAPFQFTVESQGTVTPKIKSSLVSQVSGQVTVVSPLFVVGGFFKQGDVLIEIESADYQTALKSALANLARAKATLAEEKARSKVAEKEWNQFMKGKAPELYIRKPQLAREVANVRAAEADVERAKRNLARAKIRAPFNGIVKTKQVDLGQFINTGAKLADIFGTDTAEVRLPVSDQEMSFMSFKNAFEIKKQKPMVQLSIENNESVWNGTIVRTEGIVDEKSRLVYLVAELKDPYAINSYGAAIEFGRFAKAKVKGLTLSSVVAVNREYLREGNKVLLVKNGKIDIVTAEVKKADQVNAYVTSGINDGDKIVTTNIKNPMQGTEVKIIETSAGIN